MNKASWSPLAPIHTGLDLFGRDDALRWLRDWQTGGKRPVLITSSRAMGRTSLLHTYMEQAKAHSCLLPCRSGIRAALSLQRHRDVAGQQGADAPEVLLRVAAAQLRKGRSKLVKSAGRFLQPCQTAHLAPSMPHI